MENPNKVKVLLPGGMTEPFWYDLGQAAAEEAPVGRFVQVPLQSKTVAGLVVETGSPDLKFKTKSVTALAPQDAKAPPDWIHLLEWLAAYYFTPLPQVFAAALPKPAFAQLFSPKPAKPIKTAKAAKPKKSKKSKELNGAEPAPREAPLQPPVPPLVPTAEQASAISAVAACMSPFAFQPFLLHGITGSGKTLVYLHLAARTLEAGRNVLVLLPEIALTPQALSRFRAYLRRPVLAFHSNLSAADRRELWRALFAGEAQVIVGARSAALCPLGNLGLIVVDEEHDGSFKQSDASPRYNARDVALYRGRQAGCPVVLGSATPSLESYHAARAGKYRLLELHARATGSNPPKVVIVDMRNQYDLQGGEAISIPLREALQAALEAKEQAILFLNRRGYAPRRLCKACGEARQCPHCAIPLVYHKARRGLLCHYCGYALDMQAPCLHCAGNSWLDVGRGVEKVEEYLQDIFPRASIARLDRDTASTLHGAEDILERFRAGGIDILLGTQMVAKGHDFPKVNLVGVIDADAGLGLSDFRAQERAFQLITQVSGRAGRHRDLGKVFLQTFKPDSPLLAFALSHDYAGFFEAEIARRQELDYPPFRRLLLVEITGSGERDVESAMAEFADIFRHFAAQADIAALGPAFAVMKKIKDQYRAHILAKGKAPNQLQWALKETLARYHPKEPNKIKVRVDVDPLSML